MSLERHPTERDVCDGEASGSERWNYSVYIINVCIYDIYTHISTFICACMYVCMYDIVCVCVVGIMEHNT